MLSLVTWKAEEVENVKSLLLVMLHLVLQETQQS
jgi:hypothetical protein